MTQSPVPIPAACRCCCLTTCSSLRSLNRRADCYNQTTQPFNNEPQAAHPQRRIDTNNIPLFVVFVTSFSSTCGRRKSATGTLRDLTFPQQRTDLNLKKVTELQTKWPTLKGQTAINANNPTASGRRAQVFQLGPPGVHIVPLLIPVICWLTAHVCNAADSFWTTSITRPSLCRATSVRVVSVRTQAARGAG